MIKILSILFLFMGLACRRLILPAVDAAPPSLETYIVHVEPPVARISAQEELVHLESHYLSFLPTRANNLDEDQPCILHSYRNVFIGFAAKLSVEHVKQMEGKPGFISAQKQHILTLAHYTFSQFHGVGPKDRLPSVAKGKTGFWPKSNYGRCVIIGLVDSGVTTGHPSFSGKGMPPPLAKWKGQCKLFSKPSCNNKLIGARNFLDEHHDASDDTGHDTHTASTAAGNYVKGANANGNANGTAAGMAPLALGNIQSVRGYLL